MGLLTVSPTTAGVGGVRVDNADVENETIARANCNQYDGQEVYGPFEHSSRRLLITVQGTGTHASVYAWKDAEGRRWIVSNKEKVIFISAMFRSKDNLSSSDN